MEIKYAGLNTLAAFYEKCKEKFALLTHKHSWNDLDDKPFGEMVGETVVILPETSFESAGGEELTYIGSSQIPTAEQEYTVVFDDIEYNITTVAGNNVDNASLDDGCVVFGNAALMFGTIQNFGDYPFFIVYNSSDSGFNIYTEDSGTHKVEIYKNDTTIKQLDEKYLPDHTHETSEVNGLDELLENKSDSGHTHNSSEISYDASTDLIIGENIDDAFAKVDEILSDIKMNKSDTEHKHIISDITDLQSTLNKKVEQTSLDELSEIVNSKVDSSTLDNYYTKTEIDNYEFITVEDIDEICEATTGVKFLDANEVIF